MQTKIAIVLIQYNLENVLPREYPLHEVPILQVVHGHNNITLDKILRDGDNINPRSELIRLRKAYQSKRDAEGTNPVELAFPDGTRDMELFYKEGFEAYSQRMLHDHAVALGEVDEDEEGVEVLDENFDEVPRDQVETDDTDDLDDAPEGLDRAAIVQQLKALKVPYRGNAATAVLHEQLLQAQLGNPPATGTGG